MLIIIIAAAAAAAAAIERYTKMMSSTAHPYTTSVRSTYLIPEVTGAPS
jgi:hypothetical protein